MSYEEMQELLSSTGIPFAFHHWEEAPPPPYGVYFDDQSDSFGADNVTYYAARHYMVELYLSQRDEAVEEALEAILTGAELYWDKYVQYVEQLRQFQISYEVEV